MSLSRPTAVPDQSASGVSPQLPDIQAHSCVLFYSLKGVDFSTAPDFRLGNLRPGSETGSSAENSAWLSADLLQSISDKRAEWPIWEPTVLSLGNDLHPHVARLLGGRGHEAGSDSGSGDPLRENHARVFRLTEAAGKLVHGERLAHARETPPEERRPHRLVLDFGPQAWGRIRRQVPQYPQESLVVEVLDLHLVVFRTGFAFLMVQVRFAGAEGLLPSAVLTEALHSLSRINRMTWQRADGQPLADAPVFSFATLVRSLMGEPGKGRAERVFTATCLQFSNSADAAELDRLLLRLARHYTVDYLVRDDLPGTERVAHFRNVHHVFTLEGSVTAVDLSGYPADATPEFLREYQNVTYLRHYLPIILLACHEACFLLHLTNDASFWPCPQRMAADRRRMLEIRRDIVNFRLCFSFSQVSQISMHNAVNDALRRALRLDRMLDELGRDTAEIDVFLDRLAEREMAERARLHERRFRWASVIGVFGITWLTTHTLFKELFELPYVHELLHLAHDQATLVAALCALVISVIAAILVLFRGETSHSHGLTEHAIHDNILHQAEH